MARAALCGMACHGAGLLWAARLPRTVCMCSTAMPSRASAPYSAGLIFCMEGPVPMMSSSVRRSGGERVRGMRREAADMSEQTGHGACARQASTHQSSVL